MLSLLTALFLKWGRPTRKAFSEGQRVLLRNLLGTGCSVCFFSGGSLGWGRWVAPDAAYLASYTPALLVVLAIGAISVHQDLPSAKRGFLCFGLGIAVLLLFAAIELRPYVRPLRLASSDQWLGDVCLQAMRAVVCPLHLSISCTALE